MSAQRVLPSGPVFISYRQSDGQTIATALAWLLRATGIPVWQDQSDLPPGDTNERLAGARDSGLSGACLLTTRDIAKSGVVRTVELYVLARDPAFVFAVANTVRKRSGKLDYAAPWLQVRCGAGGGCRPWWCGPRRCWWGSHTRRTGGRC